MSNQTLTKKNIIHSTIKNFGFRILIKSLLYPLCKLQIRIYDFWWKRGQILISNCGYKFRWPSLNCTLFDLQPFIIFVFLLNNEAILFATVAQHVAHSLIIEEMMGSIISPNRMLDKEFWIFTYCCYFKCATLIIWVSWPLEGATHYHAQLCLQMSCNQRVGQKLMGSRAFGPNKRLPWGCYLPSPKVWFVWSYSINKIYSVDLWLYKFFIGPRQSDDITSYILLGYVL